MKSQSISGFDSGFRKMLFKDAGFGYKWIKVNVGFGSISNEKYL